MNINSVKIVADSSCDLLNLCNVKFECAPLKIITAQKEYVDTLTLDVSQLVSDLQSYKGKSTTSCPNASDWLNAFGDAEYIFCITITATLSGSYNAALLAKETYENEHPGRHVFVLDSLSTGPEMALIIEKLEELILSGKEFYEICNYITLYSQQTGLLFMLESMKNLANNGRVNPIVAKMAGILGIRIVGKASEKGDLEPLDKCRGEAKALEAITGHMQSLGLKSGKVIISHCQNPSAAHVLKCIIENKFESVQIKIFECRALCSFYAEKGGMLIGFEKM